MTDEEMTAIVYVVEKLADNPGDALIGMMLATIGERPGVEVRVDWPTFLGVDAAVFEETVAARVAEYAAEQKAREDFRVRSEQVKAGLARRKAEGLPVGRRTGAKDARPRRKSGYLARWEKERDRTPRRPSTSPHQETS
jgi:hypothetical protein